MHHNLKVFTPNFQPIVTGVKRHDVRMNDRNFQAGDTVTLFEGEHSEGEFIKTGRSVSAIVSYVDSYGVQQGYVALSYSKVGMVIADGAV